MFASGGGHRVSELHPDGLNQRICKARRVTGGGGADAPDPESGT